MFLYRTLSPLSLLPSYRVGSAHHTVRISYAMLALYPDHNHTLANNYSYS